MKCKKCKWYDKFFCHCEVSGKSQMPDYECIIDEDMEELI